MQRYADQYGFERHDFVANAPVDARADFLMKTYLHLFGAMLAFCGLTALFVNLPFTKPFIMAYFTSPITQLIVLGAFMLTSWLASAMAHSSTSQSTQYLGLGLYVLAESLIFTPLLFIAANYTAPWTIPAAGITTILCFGALSATVIITRKNFSFLYPILSIISFAVLAAFICAAFIPGFSLAEWKGWLLPLMIVVASGYVLVHTSQVMFEYQVGQHVAASLALFSSVALLFWYVLQYVMSISERD